MKTTPASQPGMSTGAATKQARSRLDSTRTAYAMCRMCLACMQDQVHAPPVEQMRCVLLLVMIWTCPAEGTQLRKLSCGLVKRLLPHVHEAHASVHLEVCSLHFWQCRPRTKSLVTSCSCVYLHAGTRGRGEAALLLTKPACRAIRRSPINIKWLLADPTHATLPIVLAAGNLGQLGGQSQQPPAMQAVCKNPVQTR